ncbi:hypothetical protein [Mucilaginibacter aquaedulcis]|jgi:predicted RNA-binding protein (virulence factor B family)|nr:hypothetical protein [Mucilaginibacter aquaedulcis]MDN3547038.1 hypothetical protein [Mucilaginibacter aquaedulcis]
MKRTILLALLIVSTGVLSSSSKSTPEAVVASFGKTTAAFKRDLGSAD